MERQSGITVSMSVVCGCARRGKRTRSDGEKPGLDVATLAGHIEDAPDEE
jgi:hypothetical protein